MTNRSVRLAVVAVVVLATCGAAWQIWRLEDERAAGLDAARRFDAISRGLVADLGDLRASQQAYVAEGQREVDWFGKATSVWDSLRARLAEARAAAASPEARQAIQAATDLLASFEKTDGQARELAGSDQRLMASDLIFGEGATTIAAIAERLDEAQAREAADAGRRLDRTRAIETAVAAAAAAAAVIGLLLLLPAGGVTRQPEHRTSIAPTREAPAAATPTPPPPAPAPTPAPSPAPDLAAVAALCTEFGRVGDPTVLPHLIEEAAALLDASGLIVWMVNPKAGALQPVLSHGYSELALTRIGELKSDEDNATAEAFRTRQVRIVEGIDGGHGAIAVPVVTPAGCVGVLAAEVRGGGEKNSATQAIAAIVAAQLASLSSASAAAT